MGSLKPNETVLKLYENILEDVRKEQISDSLEEVELLKSKMQTFKNRIQRAKDLYLDGEMSKEDKDEAVSHNQKSWMNYKTRWICWKWGIVQRLNQS